MDPRLGKALAVVNEQANDEALWFQPVYITEDILQQALRRLHEAIEGKSAEECAMDVLDRPASPDVSPLASIEALSSGGSE